MEEPQAIATCKDQMSRRGLLVAAGSLTAVAASGGVAVAEEKEKKYAHWSSFEEVKGEPTRGTLDITIELYHGIKTFLAFYFDAGGWVNLTVTDLAKNKVIVEKKFGQGNSQNQTTVIMLWDGSAGETYGKYRISAGGGPNAHMFANYAVV